MTDIWTEDQGGTETPEIPPAGETWGEAPSAPTLGWLLGPSTGCSDTTAELPGWLRLPRKPTGLDLAQACRASGV